MSSPKKVLKTPAKIDVMEFAYKQRHSLEERKRIFARAITGSPHLIPVYVEPTSEAVQALNLNVADPSQRDRYLAPRDLSCNQFQLLVRKRLIPESQEDPSITLFLYTHGPGASATLCNLGSSIGDVYQKFKEEDGCLYMRVSMENAFGGQR